MLERQKDDSSTPDPRAFMESLIHSSNDAIITKTLDGTVTSWNPAAERIFGYTAAEAIGQNLFTFAFIPAERRHEETQILACIGRGERTEHFETVRLRKDGSLVDVSISVSPIRDLHGRVVGASKIARDISERKQIEDRMRAAVKELQDIKAALDEHSIVAITDPAGRITYVNDKFCSISKYSREELLGRDHRIINSRHHSKEFFRQLWQTIGSGHTWRGEICNRAKDGSLYWVDTTIFPCIGPSGKPTQYVAIRTDITQRKADAINLQQYAEQLAEKNKELEAIVYTVSHDLRSPLVNIQGFGKRLVRACETLQAGIGAADNGQAASTPSVKEALEATIPQSLRFINAGVAKMEVLLAGLLRYSRLGRESLAIEQLDMNTLWAETLAAMKFQLESIKANVRLEPLPECRGDRGQVSQVLSNLVDNALKYRCPDRVLQITVRGRLEDGCAIYSVEDNGIGIAQEHQAKIFEIFHRLNPDRTPGEGLGLTIAQRMLERQKGKVWVESDGVQGSTFFVLLPSGRPQTNSNP